MITYVCDGCQERIDIWKAAWFGVDHIVPEPPDSDDFEVIGPDEFDGEYKHHFCSAKCMSAWAFTKELNDD